MKRFFCFLVVIAFLFSSNISYSSELKYTSISCGIYHCLALKSDGTVYGWGFGGFGQLASLTDTAEFKQIPELKDVVQVACGQSHSLVLLKDGTVYSFGSNDKGQLGVGEYGEVVPGTIPPTLVNSSKPLKISKLSNVNRIFVSSDSNFAVKNDGTMWCWGDNFSGKINADYGETIYEPVLMEGLKNVLSLSVGQSRSILVLNNGKVYSAGGSKTNIMHPYTSLGNIKKSLISAYGTLFLTDDGAVYDMGGLELGPGDTEKTAYPRLLDLSNIIDISSVFTHVLALDNKGHVWASGFNRSGEIGNGTYSDTLKPFKLDLENVVSIGAGYGFSFALKSDGSLYYWGSNCYFGDENQGTNIPVEIQNAVPITIDGKKMLLNFPATIINGRTLVPVKDIFESFGCNVEWDGSTQTITGKKGQTVIKLKVNSKDAYVNGTKLLLDVPPMLRSNRTLVPLRFISESFGAKVEWDQSKNEVCITKN